MSWEIKQGDALERLREMPDGSVHCCVTSPPYWGLRDYGVSGQLGLEKTPELYVSRMTEVFREVRRVLRSDGTLWLNIGDSYCSGSSGGYDRSRVGVGKNLGGTASDFTSAPNRMPLPGLKDKDLCGVPWLLAFALRSDGWYLRQDIIWSKPNPMPESVTDRCTKAHEYLFLLSKSGRYFYDAAAILEDCSENTHARLSQDVEAQIGSARANGGTRAARPMKDLAPASWRGSEFNTGKTGEHQLGRSSKNRKLAEPGSGIKNNSSFNEACCLRVEKRNRRSVWEVTTQPFSEAHFATFPPKLIEPCILAGCPPTGKRCDCAEVIATPTGTGEIDDPSIETGRAGMNRPRRPDEGTRPITRKEQREYAAQLRESAHKPEMEREAGKAFEHYIRTDKSGARPVPQDLLDSWIERGWLRIVSRECACPEEPAGTVLDPFAGAGTTGLVSTRLQRNFIGIELNPAYVEMAEKRITQDAPLFNSAESYGVADGPRGPVA